MSTQTKGQLVYKPVQSISLPAQLEARFQVRSCPREVLDLRAKFLAVRGRVEKLRLIVGGNLKISGSLVLPDGRIQALGITSGFGVDLSLPEPVQAGHVVITPQVEGLTYTVSCSEHKEAEVKLIVFSTFEVKVMSAQPCQLSKLLAHCCFRPVLLPVVLATQAESFQRKLLLPLDPPGRKIVRVDIEQQGARADLALPLVVSGIAKEEILYLGVDGRIHQLQHTTDWNYLWSREPRQPAGELLVSAQGEIVRAELLSSGHTLSLSIKEQVELQVCEERKQDILIAEDHRSPDQIILARIPLILAEQSCSELVPIVAKLSEAPAVPGRPQVKTVNLSGRSDFGQVTVHGELEVAFPYVDSQGRERLHHVTSPLIKVLVVQESRPGQVVKVRGRVESVQFGVTNGDKLEIQALCAFDVCLLKLEKVGLAGDQVPSPKRWNQVQVRAQQLVGQQNQDLLLEQVVDFNDENVVILDHSVCSKVHGAHPDYGTLISRGEVQVSLYYLSAVGEERCHEISLPWQVILAIPGAEPRLIPDVNIEAGLLPLSVDKKDKKAVVRVACKIEGSVYRPAVLPVITELKAIDNTTTEQPVQAVIRQEAELELIIKPRSWSLLYETDVSVEVQQVNWQPGQGEVVGTGELVITATYARPNGVLQKWQEMRPFQFTFFCSEAEPGLKVCGELNIIEMSYQIAASKNAQGPVAAGRYLFANVVFRADLVLL